MEQANTLVRCNLCESTRQAGNVAPDTGKVIRNSAGINDNMHVNTCSVTGMEQDKFGGGIESMIRNVWHKSNPSSDNRQGVPSCSD
jgi:hypothetical protein